MVKKKLYARKMKWMAMKWIDHPDMDNYIYPYAYYLFASLYHKTSSMPGGGGSTDNSIIVLDMVVVVVMSTNI